MDKELKVVYVDKLDTNFKIVATSFYIDRTKKWQKGKTDKAKEIDKER
jgi:hypothetical protein